MDYKNYDIEDFVTDRSFINYYLGTNQVDIEFWQEWINKNQDKAELINQVKSQLNIIYHKLPDNEYEEEFVKFKNTISSTKHTENIDSTVLRKFPKRWTYIRLVAGLVLLIVSSILYLTWKRQNASENISFTNLSNSILIEKYAYRGQKNTIILKDGSKIKLNSDSKIRFPENFNDSIREVQLEGEAFFEVEHDSLRPFIVKSGGIRTKVLGTSFNIKNFKSHNKVEIALVTGKVEVVQKSSQHIITLSPNELLEVNNETNNILKRSFEPVNELGWKDGIIQFKKAKINEIIEVLESWYDIEIEYRKSPNNKGFTGEFDNESLETVLKGLSFSIGFDFELEGNKVTIY